MEKCAAAKSEYRQNPLVRFFRYLALSMIYSGEKRDMSVLSSVGYIIAFFTKASDQEKRSVANGHLPKEIMEK